MKIYLAAPYSLKYEVSKKADHLRRLGFIVTSSWLEEPERPDIQLQDLSNKERIERAVRNLNDVDAADALVLFSHPDSRGGKHVEFGHARNKIRIVVGPHENIFHYLPMVNVVPTWLDAVEILMEEKNGYHVIQTIHCGDRLD